VPSAATRASPADLESPLAPHSIENIDRWYYRRHELRCELHDGDTGERTMGESGATGTV